MIQIVPYSAEWAQAFDAEAVALRGVLRELAIRIEHVGSTAVPGLAAKPVIDIQVSVPSLAPPDQFRTVLARLDYRFVSVGAFDGVYPWFVKPGEWPTTHHVHLCVAGGEQEAQHLAFRDYLRSHPGEASRYEALKRELARVHEGNDLRSIERYSLAKGEFVRSALARAGFAWL